MILGHLGNPHTVRQRGGTWNDPALHKSTMVITTGRRFPNIPSFSTLECVYKNNLAWISSPQVAEEVMKYLVILNLEVSLIKQQISGGIWIFSSSFSSGSTRDSTLFLLGSLGHEQILGSTGSGPWKKKMHKGLNTKETRKKKGVGQLRNWYANICNTNCFHLHF